MPDDKSKKFPHDASLINIHEPYELEYWSKRFRVTPQELRNAVAAVGTSAAAVERHLKPAGETT